MARMPRARARCAAAAMASASATVLAIGFSHSTCLPASSAAMEISACESPGVHTSMSCTSSRPSRARQPVSVAAKPYRCAAAAVAAGSRPHSTASTGRSGRPNTCGAVRQACEWAAPMNAYPAMPTPRTG